MKKGYMIVIIILLIVIAVLLFALLNKNSDEPKNESNEYNNTISLENIIKDNDMEKIIEEKLKTNNSDYVVKKGESSSKDSFYGYTYDEWKKMITDYYKDEYEISIGKLDIEETSSNNLSVKIYDDVNDLIDTYTVDQTNGVAISNFEIPVDFEKGEQIEYPYESKVHFTDSVCCGIGQIDLSYGLKSVANKFLSDNENIDNITIVEHPEGGSQAFIIVPRYKDIVFSIQTCHIGEDGELYGDEYILEETKGPIIVKNVEIEYMPKFMINLDYRGFNLSYPLTFSGEDGSIYLDEYASELVDISN